MTFTSFKQAQPTHKGQVLPKLGCTQQTDTTTFRKVSPVTGSLPLGGHSTVNNSLASPPWAQGLSWAMAGWCALYNEDCQTCPPPEWYWASQILLCLVWLQSTSPGRVTHCGQLISYLCRGSNCCLFLNLATIPKGTLQLGSLRKTSPRNEWNEWGL